MLSLARANLKRADGLGLIVRQTFDEHDASMRASLGHRQPTT